jgi:glycosyltransferase involved in cell wall biosynthesis
VSVKRALVCAPLMPDYDCQSGSQRIFDLIKSLREAGWAVSFVAQNGSTPGAERYAKILQQLGVATYAGFNSQTDQLVAASHFNVVIFAFWYLAELYMPVIRALSPATRVIVDSIDLHFVRQARRIFLHEGVLDLDYASEMIREVNTYAMADGVLAVSQKEADLINDLVGDLTSAYTVPDSEDLKPSTIPFVERKGILFVGNFQHPPNVEAVEYLCKDILPQLDPAILAEHPVYIVGSALNETVRSCGNKLANVRFVGWVPSVLPYLEHTRVSVVPLLYGAGTKRKLIQALMVGTPCVSTSIGIEGLNLRNGEHVLVADDPATFAHSIARLLEDAELWQYLVRQGQAHIAAVHSHEAIRTRLMQVISAVLAKETMSALLVEPSLEHHRHRLNQQYRQLIERVKGVVQAHVPPDATVVVVSRGDEELLKLGGRRAWHFPQCEGGVYAGYYPADSSEAIVQLEELRAKGADFLLFPRTSQWWLRHYDGFKQHIESHYRVVVYQEESCLIFALREPAIESEITSTMERK